MKAHELETLTDRARNLGDRRDAFETMRDVAADAYRVHTGDVWRPRHGSHASQTGQLTSAAIDARDFRRARQDRETRAHLPDGTLVAIAGGKSAQTRTPSGARSTAPARSTATWCCCTAAARATRRSRPAGRTRAASTRWCAARTERPRQGRALPQRRAAEPACRSASSRSRIGHHRKPGRQGPAAWHPGHEHRRVTAAPPRPDRAGSSLRRGIGPPFAPLPEPRIDAERPARRFAPAPLALPAPRHRFASGSRGLASGSALARPRRTLACPFPPAAVSPSQRVGSPFCERHSADALRAPPPAPSQLPFFPRPLWTPPSFHLWQP